MSGEGHTFFTLGGKKYLIEFTYIATLILITYTDFKKKRIPDFLVIMIGLYGIIDAFFTDNISFNKRILGMVSAMIIFFLILICAPGSFGGGDVKLSVVLGFYMGVQRWIRSFMYAVILAAFYMGILFFMKKYDRKQEIAFGPFLCAGAVIAGILK